MKARTPVEYALLEALGRYRLLTSKQGARLGIANYTHIGERFRSLRTAGLVLATERGKLAGPHVFCLSNKGAAALAEWSEGEIILSGRAAPYADTEPLNQRVAIVDVHIALREWAHSVGATVNWLQVEFDPNPSGLAEPVTAVAHNELRYDPDLVASVTDRDGQSWLLAVEMETGGRAGLISNFGKHLDSRLAALKGRVLENAHNWPQDNNHKLARMLFVFKDAAMMARAKKIAVKGNSDEWRRVFLTALPLNAISFETDWWKIDGGTGSPLRAIEPK